MMERFSFWLLMVGLGTFCASIIGWASLGISGFHFAGERILQAGFLLMVVLLTSGGVVHYFNERKKKEW